MARRRREPSPSSIKLRHPDRSGPSEKTLLEIAQERGLFDQAKKREEEIGKQAAPIRIPRPQKDDNDEEEDDDDDDDDEVGLSPGAERVFETLLWTMSLSMLHFTLDVLVYHQYSVDRISWPNVWQRFAQAFSVFGLLIYFLHPHAANPGLVPGLSPRYQAALRQTIFFVTSVYAGCYLIHITNTAGYLAVMKQAPPLGCIWVWSVIELDLPWAVLSLAGAGAFLWQKGYSIK